ncbi:glycosyltransferase, partial [Thermovibrio sp.]
NGQNGYLISGLQDGVDRLKDLIFNLEKRLLFGMESRKIVKEKFSLQRMISNYKELYRSLVEF